MVFAKDNYAPFMTKGSGQKLIGAGKGVIRMLDNDIANSVISALSPELGLGLSAARKSGILEKLK